MKQLLLFVLLGISTTAHALDLMQTYLLALANDTTYASARHEYDAGQEKITQGRSQLLPTVAIQGTNLRKENSDYKNSYGLVLSQPLFRVGNWEAYQQGKLATALSDIQIESAKQALMLRVTKAYFDVLSAEDSVYFLVAQKQAIAEQLASAQRNFEVGSATITDTNEAQARYDLATAQEIAAQNALALAQNTLTQIIGQITGPLSTLKSPIQIPSPEPANMLRWTQQAESENFQVLGQRLSLEIAQSQTRKSRADHYPTVDLQATRTHVSQRTANNPYETGRGTGNGIQIQWTIPLFTGFATTSKTAESIAMEDKARSDLDGARRQAILNAQQAYLGVTSGLSQIKAYEAAEKSSLSAVESNKLGYQVGIRINIDVLNAQQQLFSTRKDLARARYDTLIHTLQLKAAVGTLQESDLEGINQLLTMPRELDAPTAMTE